MAPGAASDGCCNADVTFVITRRWPSRPCSIRHSRGSAAAAGDFRGPVEHRQHVGGAPRALERPSSYLRPVHVNGTTKLKQLPVRLGALEFDLHVRKTRASRRTARLRKQHFTDFDPHGVGRFVHKHWPRQRPRTGLRSRSRRIWRASSPQVRGSSTHPGGLGGLIPASAGQTSTFSP